MPANVYSLANVNAKLLGIDLGEGFDATSEFVVVSEAHHFLVDLPPVGVEVAREDVSEAVFDALALRNTPPSDDPFDFLGYSDPVYLAPLELRF